MDARRRNIVVRPFINILKEKTMTAFSKRSFSRMLLQPRGLLSCISVMTAALMLLTLSSPLLAEVGQQEINLPQLSDVVCQSYIVYDRTKGEALISQNPDQQIFPASMTKIMTASLALDYLKTDQILTVSQSAISATTPNSTLMGLVVGEEISVSELLYGLMLPSGNDAANVLAEAVVTATGYTDPSTVTPTKADGSPGTAVVRTQLDLFGDIMNQKVAELGLTNTHFINANGLHDGNHYTTASDLARIFDYALSHEDFRTVISSPTHVFKATNKHNFDAWSVTKNTNCLLTDPWLLGADTTVAKVVGGKTGTTIPAGTGMTLLSIDKNGDELISVVCGIPYETANRLTSYMAAILDAGAAVCFEKDSVVRFQGNVMDNKPYNATAGFGPSGQAAAPTATPTVTPGAATVAASATVTPAAGTDSPGTDTDQNEPGFPLNVIKAHPVLSAAAGFFLLIVILLVIVYFSVNRKRRRRHNGIRRI